MLITLPENVESCEIFSSVAELVDIKMRQIIQAKFFCQLLRKEILGHTACNMNIILSNKLPDC